MLQTEKYFIISYDSQSKHEKKNRTYYQIEVSIPISHKNKTALTSINGTPLYIKNQL